MKMFFINYTLAFSNVCDISSPYVDGGIAYSVALIPFFRLKISTFDSLIEKKFLPRFYQRITLMMFKILIVKHDPSKLKVSFVRISRYAFGFSARRSYPFISTGFSH